ncbi:hypothetical protein OF83DRAFT_1068214 [Amylostereum chailletii]|nr:hypothetical protein OF83DRAFT_1068214 [Amylostereum chailletii]
MALQRNGYPESEVIVNYADGNSYSKGKMEEAVRVIFEKPLPKLLRPASTFKKEDIDFIVSELEIPRAQAEKALAEHEGDLQKTLRALITP